MSFGTFNLMLESMVFGGNVRTLWKELAKQKNGPLRNSIPFQVLDPEAQNLLMQCRGQLLFNFGTLVKAWREGFLCLGIPLFDEEGWAQACAKIGLSFKN